MRIVIVADAYPPLRSSAAVQLRDLSLEFVRQGHDTTVLIPTQGVSGGWHAEIWGGVRVVRLPAPRSKDVGYIRRTLAEWWTPYAMRRNLRNSPLGGERWDGVVWYSPTIFLGPMAKALKEASRCKGYLIIRDIFPEWAVDMELMGRGLPYQFFKAIERQQYAVADVIGVQTPANLAYFEAWTKNRQDRRVEVLQNWLSPAPDTGCSITIDQTPLAKRKIFVYAGNMGVAQGMDVWLHLAERLIERRDIGFLFVGRGSDTQRLREAAKSRGLENVMFHDEIDPAEIPGLYAQCHIGLVSLDPRHKTHNIPGKFLSYMQAGLPVLASINPGNDLKDLIDEARVGQVVTNGDVLSLREGALRMVEDGSKDSEIRDRCKLLAASMFSPEVAVRQIAQALKE